MQWDIIYTVKNWGSACTLLLKSKEGKPSSVSYFLLFKTGLYKLQRKSTKEMFVGFTVERFSKAVNWKMYLYQRILREKEKPASWIQFLHITNHTGYRVAGCLPIFVAGTLRTPSLQGNWTGVVSSWMDLMLGFKSRFSSW